MATLTRTAFELLLARLDKDPQAAAEQYEELRLKLVKFFVWSRRCPESQADALADETLDRVARKLEQGIVIENLQSYACEVSRYVWLEHQRNMKEEGWGDQAPEIPVEVEKPETQDERFRYLQRCLAEVASNEKDRTLILGYYDIAEEEKNKEKRKTLAERFGLTMNAVRVRASRLREKIERCINKRMKNKNRV